MSRGYHLPPGTQARFAAGRPTDADLIRMQRARADARSEYRVIWIMMILITVFTLGFGLIVTGPIMLMLIVRQTREAQAWAAMSQTYSHAQEARRIEAQRKAALDISRWR